MELESPQPQSSYIRHIPQSQNCDAEEKITIEAVYLGKSSRQGSIVRDLRHLDPQIGVVLFYGAMTAIIFFFFYKKYKNMIMSSLYTASSVTAIALSLSAALGIDFLGAVGAAILPH